MPDPKIPGRMIRRSIATSKGVAKLGPESTAIFCMVIPHLDSYGKMLGEPAVVKEVALPLVKWATVVVIAKALREINRHTNLKWWLDKDGRRYLHAIHFEKHQELRADRRGADHLPSYPGLSPDKLPDLVQDLVRPEVEVEVEVEGKVEEEFEVEVPKATVASAGALRPPLETAPLQNSNGIPKASGKKGRVTDAIPPFRDPLKGGAGGNGSKETIKEMALNEVTRLVSTGELDLAGASDRLRTFGFTHLEINEPASPGVAAEGGELMATLQPHPTYSPTGACDALECNRRAFRIDACREEGCGHRWQREGAEDRKAREKGQAAGGRNAHL